MISRRLQLAAAAGAVAGATVVGSFGPLVRREVRAAAERYGATVAVSSVAPSWLGVRLYGVDVSLEGVPSVAIHFDELEVGAFGAHRLRIWGGAIAAVGPRDVVAAQIEDWRARHRPSGEGGGSSVRPIEVRGVDVLWRDAAEAATHALTLVGVDLDRTAEATEVGAHMAIAATGPATVVVQDGRVGLTRARDAYRLRSVAAEAVDARLVVPPHAEPEPATDDPAATGQTAPQPTASPRSPRVKPVRSAPTQPVATVPDAVAPRDQAARSLRAALLEGMAVLDRTLDDNAAIELPSVHAEIGRVGETLNLGPGPLRIQRDPAHVVVELAPGGAGAGQQLTFRLIVPRPSAASQDIVADVTGGPIGLAALGVHEGDLGLIHVSDTSIVTTSHVVLAADGRTLQFDGDGKITNLSIRNAALSEEAVMGTAAAFRAKGLLALDGSTVRLDDAELDLGAIRLLVHGTVEGTGDRRVVKGEYEVPMTSCQAALDSVPKGLVPKLAGMKVAGAFAIKGHARFDTARLDKDYDVRWNATNSCRVVEVPGAIDVEKFRQAFHRVAYTPEGERVEIEVGPGTPGWIPYGGISKFMEAAILTTEDGGFFRHHGFDEEAIRNSIRENLKSKKFVRGASTVTMQLARNVYLDRTKNLSRKVQEAVLTMYLEQALTKEQIMELYLNVIEFAPMIYGVGPAAQHYFNVDASELTLSQSLYLSSILPNPKIQHFGADGEVTPTWSAYLRKLMRLANKRNRINDSELDEGLRETPVRGSPAPRRSATAPHDEDADSAD